jgi:hypothetical protein
MEVSWSSTSPHLTHEGLAMRQARHVFFVALVLLVFFAPPACAAFMGSFSLDECAWHATHIVVVTEGKKIDGIVDVIESWKGDLMKGRPLRSLSLPHSPWKSRASFTGPSRAFPQRTTTALHR